MATIPTSNAIPSEAPQDLAFNAGKIDEFVNSSEEAFSDRFNLARLTITGIQAQANQAITTIGFIPVDSFEAGANITARNQSLHYLSDNNYYRWDGTLPKVVSASSTPASSGGVASGAWVNVTDNTLRSALSASSGANLIGFSSSSSYSAGTVGAALKLSLPTLTYTGTMPALKAQLLVTTSPLLTNVLSANLMVVFSGFGVMANSNNPLSEFTFAVKDNQVVIQTGDNAVNIAGMPFTLTLTIKA